MTVDSGIADASSDGAADAALPARLRELLRAQARQRQVISYRALAGLAGMSPPHTIHRLTLALEELIREDAATKRPLLAALAVSRGPGALPGPGFFQLLRTLGNYEGPDQGPEAAAFHARAVEQVWNHWGHDETGGET